MGKMMSMTQMSLAIAVLGVLAFTFGILAEIKKPESGFLVVSTDNGAMKCKYSSDPSLVYGFVAISFLLASTAVGCYSLFYPYNGKSIPPNALSNTSTMVAYFLVAMWVSIMAGAVLLWTTLSELNYHLTNDMIIVQLNKTKDESSSSCPTAKTGHFGGGAFLALNASLFWMLCLMLANNAREDYFQLDKYLVGGEFDETKERLRH